MPLLPCHPYITQVESVFLNMPNLHFLPCAPVGCKFEDDVYVATSEPHGNIEGERAGGSCLHLSPAPFVLMHPCGSLPTASAAQL
jgi:hypothetical protein